ncbi:unnamed protein product, partial [marine sediment metagenome]
HAYPLRFILVGILMDMIGIWIINVLFVFNA